MISRKLVRTDLNLLVALQILLEERNVTRAAERLSVSQPALSKTLQKLRAAFDDELFTRTAHGLVPTPRAEVLARDLPALLESVESVLGNDDFDPMTYVGGFKLLLPPIVSESLLPALMAMISFVLLVVLLLLFGSAGPSSGFGTVVFHILNGTAWAIVLLAPAVCLALLVVMLWPGQPGRNKYGPVPSEARP